MSQNQRQSELVARYMKDKKVTFEVHAHMALFADPIISAGGEKTTYSAPTYEAIKGVCKSIYWKPTFIWVVDKVRIMNEIKTEVSGKKLLRTNGTNDLANYTYLTDVSYQVMAHIEWNENRSEYKGDRDWLKHYNIFAKSLMRGGRLPVFLGKSECSAYVTPIEFGVGKSFYDGTGRINLGLMYHGITYPDEAYSEETKDALMLDFAPVIMENGIIEYKRPDECIHKKIRSGEMKQFIEKEGEENGTV